MVNCEVLDPFKPVRPEELSDSQDPVAFSAKKINDCIAAANVQCELGASSKQSECTKCVQQVPKWTPTLNLDDPSLPQKYSDDINSKCNTMKNCNGQ